MLMKKIRKIRRNLHDALLYERRRVIDQHEESLRLNEFVHHVLQQEVRQKQQNSSQQVIQATADQNQTVLCTRPKQTKNKTEINI